MSHPQLFAAVGDIHGCARSLDAMLEKLAPMKDRTIVFIGDYIDRGPDSSGVIDLLLSFSRHHDCIFLRGNHEKMLLDVLENGDDHIWLINGGNNTLESYGVKSAHHIPEQHLDFIRATRLWYDTADYLFIHGGLQPEQRVGEQLENSRTKESALWERSHIHTPTAWEKTVVFGHTPVPQPIFEQHKIGIDTGCVYDRPELGKLTTVLLPEATCIEQTCLD